MSYALENGRRILGPSGALLGNLDLDGILAPAEADRFARQVVDALNADPRRPDIDSESAYLNAMAGLIGLALEKGRDPFALFAKAEALALKADDVARSPMFKRGEADARAGRAYDPPPIEREADRAAYVAGWERGRAARSR